MKSTRLRDNVGMRLQLGGPLRQHEVQLQHLTQRHVLVPARLRLKPDAPGRHLVWATHLETGHQVPPVFPRQRAGRGARRLVRHQNLYVGQRLAVVASYNTTHRPGRDTLRDQSLGMECGDGCQDCRAANDNT